MIVEVNGKSYISVKGTANSYNIHIDTIQRQLDNNENIFKSHINTTKAFQKKTGKLFSSKDRMTPKKQWLDKFANLNIL